MNTGKVKASIFMGVVIIFTYCISLTEIDPTHHYETESDNVREHIVIKKSKYIQLKRKGDTRYE